MTLNIPEAEGGQIHLNVVTVYELRVARLNILKYTEAEGGQIHLNVVTVL